MFPGRLVATFLIALIRVYQKTLSKMLGPRCRFYPSCSEYTILALRKYGLLLGCSKAIRRVIRCHPFHPGGYDPP